MAKYKHYDYSQDVLIPVSLKDQLIPGTLEFAIHTLVQTRMDTSIFDDRYSNDETGRLAYDPKILLKVILLGYARGLISSRKIESACRENVTFMALCCGQCPDHSTISTFVSSMKDQILPLFRDVLLVCEEENLLGGTVFALDGCKLPSNASRRKSGKFSDLQRKKQNIEKKVERLLKEQEEADKKDDDEDQGGGRPSDRSNRQKQIESLQKQADRIEKFLKKNGPKIGKQGREIKSNITDNDSAMMVGSHGSIQGYNGQALVDSKHQVIVHGEVFGEAQDHHLIPPILDGAKENMEAIGQSGDYFSGKTFTADSNYHDPTNLKKCDEEKLDAYIPDKRFRKRDPRFKGERRQRGRRKGRFTLSDFKYNEATDEYVCPNAKALKLQVKKTEADGVFYRRYVADEDDCRGCELKARCIRGRNGKRRYLSIPVGRVPGNLTEAMAAKIDSEKGKKIYSQRIAIVEPVFANIRTHKGMNRFTLRGKVKVNIQWLMYCMIHNIGKIVNYGFT
ncbi:MAG: IS1182 family transposase [Deltaproteobacteria bacterium]|nr:IS1182 family transposase [Deltaproteobacteria bacterium]